MMRLLHLLLLALLALAPLSQAARAADLKELVGQLASDDFDTKVAAIRALGALGDGHAIPVLRALEDGALYTTADKARLAEPDGDNYKLFDPSTALSARARTTTIDKVRVNNRMRGVIDAALGSLTLFSSRAEDRLAAAQEALKHPLDERTDALQKAYTAERDPRVKAALALALATARLRGGTKEQRLAAIGTLATSSDPQIRGLLIDQRAASNDPDIKHAIDGALGSINRRLQLIGVGLNLFEGVSLGSILLLAAIGLAITFGVMGVINMAHGEMIMLGAYTTYVVQQVFRAFLPPQWFDAYLIAAVPAAFLVTGARRRGAGARRHPLPLWPPARDAARHLGRQPRPAAAGAHDLRRAQQGGVEPVLDDRRLRAHRRRHHHLEPHRHPGLLLRRARHPGAGAAPHHASACTCAR